MNSNGHILTESQYKDKFVHNTATLKIDHYKSVLLVTVSSGSGWFHGGLVSLHPALFFLYLQQMCKS